METGVEEFLDLKTSGKLGSSTSHHCDQHCDDCRSPESDSFVAVPVIAVFTKYDALIGRANFEIDPNHIEGLSKESILTIAKNNAKNKLQAVCIEPFEQRVGDKVPHITVSSKSAIDSQGPRRSDLIRRYQQRREGMKIQWTGWSSSHF
jgi:hypothetical protein